MTIPRLLEKEIKVAARKYPIVAVLGPRQSGKTTLAKLAFPKKPYVSLEDLDTRKFAQEDPRRFLKEYPQGAILDEVQRVPELFSYLQTHSDEKQEEGLFILTGSQNFELLENISQSLAGRVSLHTLLPLSFEEIQKIPTHKNKTLDEYLFMGGYPRIFDKALSPTEWLSDYVQTYLERDVRLIKNIGDLSTFHRFLKMCAARNGQLVNFSSLADDCGIKHNTAKAWLSVLEASYLIFFLPPHLKNFNKRIKKSPKLFFYDTGLLCYLLELSEAAELATHSHRGNIFEAWVLGEILKNKFNRKMYFNLSFWQNKTGLEVDAIISRGKKSLALEIKAGQTLSPDYFKNLTLWQEVSKTSSKDCYLIYAGDESQNREFAQVIPWQQLSKIPLP